jgi:hypothetical protein
MMAGRTEREKRFALFTAVIVGLAIFYFFVVEPLDARYTRAANGAAEARAELESATRLFDRRVSLRREWRSLAGDTIVDDPAVAEGRLLDAVRTWADDARLNLTSLNPESAPRIDDVPEAFGVVVVRATGSGSRDTILAFMLEVEQSTLPVRVSEVRLDPEADDSRGGTLTLRLEARSLFDREAS